MYLLFLFVTSSVGLGPCDILNAASTPTPCVGAFSTTRALYSSYSGPLYQVKRDVDNATLDVPLLTSGGYSNSSSQDSFCGGFGCVITRIYDQSPMKNHLDIAPPGGAANHTDNPVNATKLKISAGGHAVYGALFEGEMGYRIDNTTGVAKGDEPETIYMVTQSSQANGACCYDFGNAETNNKDDGRGTMECVYFGFSNASRNWCGGSGSGPWVMACVTAFQSNSSYLLPQF